MDILPPEATVIAHERSLSLRILARPQAEYLVVVLVDFDAAAGAATGAYTVCALQPPNTFLVQEIFAAKCADRTKVDHVSSEFVVARMVWKDVDLFDTSAIDHMQLGRTTHFASESNATRAHHATVGEQSNLITDVILVQSLNLGLLQSAVGSPELVGVVLQVALASLIAN